MRVRIIGAAFVALLGLIVLYMFVSWHRAARVIPAVKTVVTIHEGRTVADINKELKTKGVLSDYELPKALEGYLYPDTYEFFAPSAPDVIFQKFISAFNSKAAPLFSGDDRSLRDVLIVASLVEREVPPDGDDRAKISGIIWKRLAGGMPLQVDASLCYVKPEPCFPLKRADMEVDSPYNTYRRSGLPPTPIGNPGYDAIYAALNPISSPYWFFLSDPKTKKTVFAKTLDEHTRNIVKYLE